MQQLQRLAADLDGPCEVHVEEGKAGPVLEALATEIGAALLVVGTAARQGLGKLFVGNTAEAIAKHSPCDLVTVNVLAT